jgi:hypothetical protein
VRSRLLLSAVLVLALAYAGLYWLGSTAAQPRYTISSKIVLPATVQESWRVLTGFEHYPQWNPYLTRVEGKLQAGETVAFTLIDKNFSEPLDLTARIGEVIPNKRFFWEGTVGVQGLFDTRHVFELQQREDGQTDLHHFEEFRGILPVLLPRAAERSANTEQAFTRMNQALAQRLGKVEP